MKHNLIFTIFLLVFFSCHEDNNAVAEIPIDNPTILEQLAKNYKQLPEHEIAISLDNRVYAQYSSPTEKYGHGILGDKMEAEQLVVVVDSIFHEFKLPDNYVFEDIRPRLYDVDGDNELELICIRTNVLQGAGIAIYKIADGQLIEYASVPEIGTSNRWLNIVTINDLDNDGAVELVWIETPHIGGILRVAKIEEGLLSLITETAQYSNHTIGERNLCLSVLTQQTNKKVFYVPSQNRNKIVGFTFTGDDFEVVEEINQIVDFSEPLRVQYNFSKVLEEENNCVNVE